KVPGSLQLRRAGAFRPILTRAPAMRRLLKEAELHAASDVPILITGESGTGKDLLARAIHQASARADKPFTAVNMAAFNPSFFDAEFFGHSRGAFTGAEKERDGYLEFTAGGTLFLDEIGILPLEVQGKLLRVLQDGEFVKLGTNRRRRADVRFIAATNENLERLMAGGRFRKDLFYRLRGGWLHLPPLRQRSEDIPLLTEHFLGTAGPAGPTAISPAAQALLCRYGFPGNVRELKSIIQSAANLAGGRPIEVRHLPAPLRQARPALDDCGNQADTETLASLEAVERKHILKVYQATGRNKARTAAVLGIGLNTLRRKLTRYGEVSG
ncbi:MAG: sigma-54 dependent transcriptional regulator, partial [Desulfobacteraceae bacterium]|nr:sigma-54 dependent transcriptional regulator [Desulfobacteraceae bacterium]